MRDFHKLGTVTIANGAAVSGAIAIPAGYSIQAVEVPSAWTAADIGFQISTDGGTTFINVYSGIGTTVARARVTGVPTAESTMQMVGADAGTSSIFRNLAINAQVKVTSINTASNADVNQGGARVLGIWIATAD